MVVDWPAVGACILPNIGGWVGSIFTVKNTKTWYKTLNKPTWTPPNWVFGPVWTILYTAMGYSSYLVWRDCGRTFRGPATVPLCLYASQLALNWAWTPLFFGAHQLKWSFIEIVVLWVNVAACGIAFYQVNQAAGLIFIPYVAWMSLATALNYSIYKNNKESSKSQ